jgi:ABC-type branched-subunit amino acid transport system substrate-binding protein
MRSGSLLVTLLMCACTAGAQPLLKPTLVGMSATLTGPTATQGRELGQGLRLGLAKGAPGGRPVQLLIRDDAGDPERRLANTRELMQAGVLALTGYDQAPPALLTLLESGGVPLVGVANGAEGLREPAHPLVFNLRAGWRDEAAAMVLHLDTIGVANVATLSLNDDLGRAGREGLREELARLAIKPVAEAVLAADADAAAVRGAVDTVCRERAQALVLMLVADLALEAVRRVRRIACAHAIYVANEAATRLGAAGAGVVVPQVVPPPTRLSVPLVADYQRAAVAAHVTPSYAGLEGYVYGRVLLEALARCARDATRRCIGTALEARPVDLGGYRVQFAPGDRRGSRYVDMTYLAADGRFRR